jgi:hypothetical protein
MTVSLLNNLYSDGQERDDWEHWVGKNMNDLNKNVSSTSLAQSYYLVHHRWDPGNKSSRISTIPSSYISCLKEEKDGFPNNPDAFYIKSTAFFFYLVIYFNFCTSITHGLFPYWRPT